MSETASSILVSAMSNSSAQKLAALKVHYRHLASQLSDVGFITKGSLVHRFMTCGNPRCRCRADPPQLHGPYWQWSTKIAGKTVTRRLSENEARLYQEWIANRQRLHAILDQMQQLSKQAAQVLLAQTPTPKTTPSPSTKSHRPATSSTQT